MKKTNENEPNGCLGCLYSIIQVIGFILTIGGLIMCLSGSGVVAGVPSMAIGLFIGRLGASIMRTPFRPKEFMKDILAFILVGTLLGSIFYFIYNNF